MQTGDGLSADQSVTSEFNPPSNSGTASPPYPIAGNWLDHPFPMALLRDHTARDKDPINTTLRRLAALIETTTAHAKSALPWLKMAILGDTRTDKGSLRHDANICGVTGLEGDYDGGGMTAEEASRRLRNAGISAIVYTTPSHTKENPRWRVLCLLSTTYLPGQRGALMDRLNGVLGGGLARESWTLSQAYYFGSVNNNPAHEVHMVDGTPIDLHDKLDAAACRWNGLGAGSDTADRTLPTAFDRPFALLHPLSARMRDYMASIGFGESEFATGLLDPHPFDRLSTPAKNEGLRQLLAAIDNTIDDSRVIWLRILFATHDALLRGATDAYDITLAWAQKGAKWTNQKDFDDAWYSFDARARGVTVGTLIHMAATAGADTSWLHANIQPAAILGQTLPLVCAPVGGTAFSTTGARRLRHVFGHLMARGVVSLFAAKTKTGKTAWLVSAALALATARNLLGQVTLNRPLRVLFINGEEPRELLLMRFKAALILHGIDEAQVSLQLTVFAAGELQGLRLTHTVAGTESVDTTGIALLDTMIAGHDAVLLDPFMSFVGSSVNTLEVMSAVMFSLNALARKHDAALLVTHHLRKGAGTDADGMDAVMGSSGLMNHCRIGFGFSAMNDTEAPKHGVLPSNARHYIAVTELGNNYAPASSDKIWIEKLGVKVPGTAEPPDYPDDDEPVAVRLAALSRLSELITNGMRHAALQAIHSGVNGAPLSDSPQAKVRHAAPVIAAALADHLHGQTDPQQLVVAKAVLDDVTGRGWVRVDPAARIPKPSGNGSDGGRGFVVEWQLTPWRNQTADESAANTTRPTEVTEVTLRSSSVDRVTGTTGDPSGGHRSSPLESVRTTSVGHPSGFIPVPCDLAAATQVATHGLPRRQRQ
jgi:hypothetical protein